MYYYGHGSWIIVVVLAAGFVMRAMGSRRRRAGRGSAPGFGPAVPQAPGAVPQAPGAVPGGPPRPPAAAPGGWGVERTGVPEGWLPDPTGRFAERYWSGTSWTGRVRSTGVPSDDPPPA